MTGPGERSSPAGLAGGKATSQPCAPARPSRRCIASGEVLTKDRLIRFVVGPDGMVQPDLGEELPGRGLWLRPRPDMLEKARRRRLFARAARAAVTVPEDLEARIGELLRRRCLERLGLAMRSGQLVAGFTKVQPLLRSGEASILIEAVDGASDGRDKLRRLGWALRPSLPVLALFDAEALGAAVGRGPTVHMALRGGTSPGGNGERLLRDARRLAEWKGAEEALRLLGVGEDAGAGDETEKCLSRP